jgi:hypothetical protein
VVDREMVPEREVEVEKEWGGLYRQKTALSDS